MNNDLLQNIVNRKNDQQIYTGIVESLTPLEVKMYAGDSAIKVKTLTSCLGMTIGSNVLMLKIMNQFIIIGVIASSKFKYRDYIIKQNDQIVNNSTSFRDDSELTLLLPSNGIFEIETRLFVDAATNTPDFKLLYNYSNVTELAYRNALGFGTNVTSSYNGEYIHFNSKGISQEANYGIAASGWNSIWEKFVVSTGSSDGTIVPRYAQLVATAENTIVKHDSFIGYTRLDV